MRPAWLLLIAVVVLADVTGCQRTNRTAELEELAQRNCGDYHQGELGTREDGARLHLDPDHTFRLEDFPDQWHQFNLAGEKVRSCKGEWRASSDDGSLVAELIVKEVNGRPANESLLFRYGSVALLISPPNDKIAAFVRDR